MNLEELVDYSDKDEAMVKDDVAGKDGVISKNENWLKIEGRNCEKNEWIIDKNGCKFLLTCKNSQIIMAILNIIIN